MFGYGADYYRKMLLDLLPQGRAWPKEEGSDLYNTMDALAQELARLDARSFKLLDEADPRTTFEMITDWERVVGLPDECSEENQTLQQRREAIVARLIQSGSINKQLYIDLAAALGYTVTVTDYKQFRTGRSRVGDALWNGDWRWAFTVTAPLDTVRYFRTGLSVAGEPLANWGNDKLECVLAKFAPAGTIILFAYE